MGSMYLCMFAQCATAVECSITTLLFGKLKIQSLTTLLRSAGVSGSTLKVDIPQNHVFFLDKFHLLMYFDNNNDGIKENLHHTNFNNQKIICQYTNRFT